jgi:hypothetical protein
MRSSWKIGGLAAACALIVAAPASAQFVWIGGGPTFPMSDYGDYAKTGFLVTGGVGTNVGEQGLSAFVEGFFGQNNHDVSGEKTTPFGALVGLEFDFAGKGADQSLYVSGAVGLLVHRYTAGSDYGSDNSKGLGVSGGLGYYFPLGSVKGFVEGRVFEARIESENTMFSGIMAGISIPVGQNSGN